MITMLVTLLIFCIVGYILWLIIEFVTAKMGLPNNLKLILYLILGLIALLYILGVLGIGPGIDVG